MGELLALLGLFLFSSNIILTKVAAGKMPLRLGFPVSVAVNVLFGALVFGLQAVFRSTPVGFHMQAFGLFLAAGAFSTYLGRWFFFRAIDVLGPAKASAFQVSNPMFTVVIAWFLLGEKLAPLDFFSIAVAIVGLAMVSYVPGIIVATLGSVRRRVTRSQLQRGKASRSLLEVFRALWASGIAIAVVSAAAYSISNVLRGAAVHRWNEPVLGATLGALVGMALHLVAQGHGLAIWRELRASRPGNLAYYVAIGVLTITAQTCSIASMRYIPVSISNLITMATPVVVTPASLYLLKNQENIRPLTVMGILLVLTGIGMLVLL
jgi:drug/metabolite transporter (DMT)-like permease